MHVYKKLFVFASLFFAIGTSRITAIQDNQQSLSLGIFDNLELRKKQVAELEAAREVLKTRAGQANSSNTHNLAKINTELANAKIRPATITPKEAEYANKHIALLNERKQNLIDLQEQWREMLELNEHHTKTVKEIIDFLQSQKPSPKTSYSWKEFRDNQIRLAEHSVKVDAYKVKKDVQRKKRNAETETLFSWQKQLDAKNREREKLIATLEDKKKIDAITAKNIRLETDIFDQEIESLHEKIERSKRIIERFDNENKYWEDFIEFEKNKLQEQKNLLAQIETRLVLNFNDVENAKAEWNTENQKSALKKELINQYKLPKKNEKNRIGMEVEYLKEKLAQNKADGKKEPIAYQITKAQLIRLKAIYQSLTEEINLLDAKKDLADALANDKEIQYNMVLVRYKIKQDEGSIDELLTSFKNKFEHATNALKNMKDKRTDAITALIETNRTIENIKKKIDKILTKKQILFANHPNEQREILISLEEAKKNSQNEIVYTQECLAVNADLIGHQEKLINQYHLIINDLDARKKTHSVWKRSGKAISLEELGKSAIEGEMFLAQIFWDTPLHASPFFILRNLKHVTLFDIIKLLVLFLIFISLFFLVRLGLLRLQHRGPSLLARYRHRTRFLYLAVTLSLVDFWIEHYVLLFSWGFMYTALTWNLGALLWPFSATPHPFYAAAFYLLSIPVLIYISQKLLLTFKKLNQALSYLFFAERFQDKFILFLTVFCYSTATIIPLRLAFLQYVPDHNSHFATVLLAAYSLTLVLTLLLFLSKEEVLRLIPSQPALLGWIKKKIEKNYYQMFIFVIGLFILSNPYVGYSNLAWFLAFAIPASALLMSGTLLAHYYVRKYSLWFFMNEDEEDFTDKFEHAKAYYSFCVIFSFIFMIIGACILIARTWGFDYTPADIWKILSDDWVVKIGIDSKIGVVEFLVFGLFLASGFLISSLTYRFVLSKLFDILRSEPGTQNTISRMVHYFIIFMSCILAFNAIHLAQFIFWIGASLGLAFGWVLKDIASDLLSGILILIERPLEIGNYVEIDSIKGAVQGTVQKIAARTTTIVTSHNHSIVIPNTDLLRKTVVNWGHGRFAVGFDINIRVEQSSDPEKIKKILIAVAQANQFILKAPATVVRLNEIEENCLVFLVRAFISARRVREQWEIAATIRTEVWKAFKENDITFARPEQIIDIRNVNPKAMSFKFDQS